MLNYLVFQKEMFMASPDKIIQDMIVDKNPRLKNEPRTKFLSGIESRDCPFIEGSRRYKSAVLGKEYPLTDEGFTQMQADEAAYWEAQKKPIDQI